MCVCVCVCVVVVVGDNWQAEIRIGAEAQGCNPFFSFVSNSLAFVKCQPRLFVSGWKARRVVLFLPEPRRASFPSTSVRETCFMCVTQSLTSVLWSEMTLRDSENDKRKISLRSQNPVLDENEAAAAATPALRYICRLSGRRRIRPFRLLRRVQISGGDPKNDYVVSSLPLSFSSRSHIGPLFCTWHCTL